MVTEVAIVRDVLRIPSELTTVVLPTQVVLEIREKMVLLGELFLSLEAHPLSDFTERGKQTNKAKAVMEVQRLSNFQEADYGRTFPWNGID